MTSPHEKCEPLSLGDKPEKLDDSIINFVYNAEAILKETVEKAMEGRKNPGKFLYVTEEERLKDRGMEIMTKEEIKERIIMVIIRSLDSEESNHELTVFNKHIEGKTKAKY